MIRKRMRAATLGLAVAALALAGCAGGASGDPSEGRRR